MGDYKKFKKGTKKIKKFIRKWFGKKCPTHLRGCHICERWALYDKLTENPFQKGE